MSGYTTTGTDSFWNQDVETSQGDEADPSDAGVTDNTPEDGSGGSTVTGGGYIPGAPDDSGVSNDSGGSDDDDDYEPASNEPSDSGGSGIYWYEDVDTSQGDDADPDDAGVTDNTPEDDDSGGGGLVDSGSSNDSTDSGGSDPEPEDEFGPELGGDPAESGGSNDGADSGDSDDSGESGGLTGDNTRDSSDADEYLDDPRQDPDNWDSDSGDAEDVTGGGRVDPEDDEWAQEQDPVDVEEQINEALAEQRAAFNEEIGALMESLPVPDQMGGSEDGGGLAPVAGFATLLALGGAWYVSRGD